MNNFNNPRKLLCSDLLFLSIILTLLFTTTCLSMSTVQYYLCNFVALVSMFAFDLFVSNGINSYSLQNLQIPGPTCIVMNVCEITANATGSYESIDGILLEIVDAADALCKCLCKSLSTMLTITMSFFTACVSMSMVRVQIDLCNFVALTFYFCKTAANAAGGDEKYCMNNSTIKYVAMELNEYDETFSTCNDETFSNMVYCSTAFLWWMYDSIWYKILRTMLLIKGTCNFFQQLKKNIIASWQVIEWTNSSITYMCLILFVICAESYSMFMPGIFSDKFSEFVHLVMSFVILSMWCAMWCAVLNLLMNRNRRRCCGGTIQCRGVGSMVRQCFCKIDFAIVKLIRMLQKKATYVVLVNWMATFCGFKKWWVEENPTILKKTKLKPMNCGIQRKKTRNKTYRMGFSSLLVLVGVLSMVGMMSVAVNGACSGSNPQICDPLPNGNGGFLAASRAGSLGGVVDDLLQDYNGDIGPVNDIGNKHDIGNKPAGSMTTLQVIAKYGSIETWDMSLVTDMTYLFYEKETMNADLSSWDVSRVTTTKGMFIEAFAFNSDLSKWAVSRVANMQNST
jgi:hypothetical protein